MAEDLQSRLLQRNMRQNDGPNVDGGAPASVRFSRRRSMANAALSKTAKSQSFKLKVAKMLGPWVDHYQRVLTFR
ncbi:hypothetical protein PUR23_17590 [Methylorubrum populi]|uniref:hypothetical protein n=1 Tax=Methylorubrum populi TaxID=223967 RepID=UPI0031F96321